MPAPSAEHLATTRRQTLDRFLDELEQWNRRVNLTTVRRADAWDRHVLESCRLLDAMHLEEGQRLIDVGSGGGVPGVVLAVLVPGAAITLLEADRRKAAFLVHLAGLLQLTNVRVDARRAEAAGHDPALRERHHVAVSRATAPAAALCELALPLVEPGGGLWALVRDPEASAAECAEASAALGGGSPIALPGPGILYVVKERRTDSHFPRRSGISARPLGSPPQPRPAHPRAEPRGR